MWARPDAGDRLAQLLVALAALSALANGLFMLFDPLGWYDAVGTVRATGPANAHFLRDIGLAYLVSAALLGHAAINLPMRWAGSLAGAGWLLLHGLLHVSEVSRAICSPGIFWQEAPGTLGLPLLALAGLGIQFGRGRISPAALPKGVFVAVFDRMLRGRAPYLADLAAAPGFATEKFAAFLPASLHRHAAPAGLWHAARLGAVRVEDCGACLALTAEAALVDGLPREAINALISGQPAGAPFDEAFAFGQAVATQSPEADALGAAIGEREGASVRTELALGVAMARVFPSIKRGLGHAVSCSIAPVRV